MLQAGSAKRTAPETWLPGVGIGDKRMLRGVKWLLGWIFGPLYALAIMLVVDFLERRARFDIRRDPAWRSQ